MIVDRMKTFSSCRADSDLTRFGEKVQVLHVYECVMKPRDWVWMDEPMFFFKGKNEENSLSASASIKSLFSLSPSSSIYHNFCQTVNHVFSSFPKKKNNNLDKLQRIAASLTAHPATGSTQTLAHVHIHAIKKASQKCFDPHPSMIVRPGVRGSVSTSRRTSQRAGTDSASSRSKRTTVNTAFGTRKLTRT